MDPFFRTPPWKPIWQRIILVGICGVALIMTFVAYFNPNVMVALTNTIWALCGF